MPREKIFYIYLLISSLDNKVFYVGKGHGRRMYWHKKHAIIGDHHNKHLQNKILKLISNGGKIIYKKVFESLDEKEVFRQEMLTIQYFGFENLCNLTEGGEGSTGYIHTEAALKKMKENAAARDWVGENNPNFGGGNWSEESRKKFSEYQKLNLLGERNPFFGKQHSKSARAKMSEYHSGKTLTEEHKLKISENHAFKGKKRPEHSKKMSGENNPKAKLTLELVRQIRNEYALGGTSYRKLAAIYGVDFTTIADIIKNKIWKE
jgi:hypothetical protein